MDKVKSSGVSDGFALELLKLEQLAHPAGNVLVSPLSVSLALAMLLNGSSGKTRQSATTALGFGPGRSRRGINETYSQLRESLAQSREVDLEMAQSLVAHADARIKPNFANKAQQYFDARIRLLNLEDPSAPVLMNSFICQKTKGRVPSVLSELDNPSDFAQMVLLNAVFFRGPWTTPFDRLLTQDEKFSRLDGSKGDCALMYRSGTFSYLGNLKFQAVRLPYGESGRFALYVFLPLAEGFFGLERMLDALADPNDGLSACFKRFKPSQGRVFLPRFRAEYASTLNESLKQLGLGDLFDDEKGELAAVLKGSAGPRITLKHKTVMEVDEDARGSELDLKSYSPPRRSHLIMAGDPFVLRADRPFCFFVRDDQNETVNIAGFINNPGVLTQNSSRENLLAQTAKQ